MIEDETCLICLDRITYQDETEKPNCECKYIYHKKCLLEFYKTKDTCPVCRTRQAEITVLPVSTIFVNNNEYNNETELSTRMKTCMVIIFVFFISFGPPIADKIIRSI